MGQDMLVFCYNFVMPVSMKQKVDFHGDVKVYFLCPSRFSPIIRSVQSAKLRHTRTSGVRTGTYLNIHFKLYALTHHLGR